MGQVMLNKYNSTTVTGHYHYLHQLTGIDNSVYVHYISTHRTIRNIIIVSIIIAGITNVVPISVLLARVGSGDTVVHPTATVSTTQVPVRPPIQVHVWPTNDAITSKTNITLEKSVNVSL